MNHKRLEVSPKFAVFLVTVSLIMVSCGGRMPAVRGQTSVVFSDNFESYPVGAANPCLGPPDSPGNCLSPPHVNINSSSLPEYWIVASGNQCEALGDCVTWSNNLGMGPNSIFAVVTEQSYSGGKSLKIGASDLGNYGDKTTAVVVVPKGLIPANSTVNWSMYFWLSHGVDIGRNYITFDLAGTRFRYNHGGNLGGWDAGLLSAEMPIGTYYLTTDTWHSIQFTVNLSNRSQTVSIDGANADFNLSGVPISVGQAFNRFGFWLLPQVANDSEKSAGPINGLYAYLDDVKISLGTVSPPLTSTNTSPVTIVTSSSSTGTFMNETTTSLMASTNVSASASSTGSQTFMIPISWRPIAFLALTLTAVVAVVLYRSYKRRRQ